jgi:cephalosporin hydroxylase
MNKPYKFTSTIKNLVKNLGDFYFWSESRREIHDLLAQYGEGCSEEILKIISLYHGKGWYKRLSAYQVHDEFKRFIDWVSDIKPKVVMEIGTAQGGTLVVWSRLVGDMVISVDLEHGIHGGGYPPQKQRLFQELVADRSTNLELIQADSHQETTRKYVENLLAGKQLDLLFIDGDHRLEGVTRDFELWNSLVKPGGYIVFHDILPHPPELDCHVDKLWNSLKNQYPSQEIVADYNQGCAGIGIIQQI